MRFFIALLSLLMIAPSLADASGTTRQTGVVPANETGLVTPQVQTQQRQQQFVTPPATDNTVSPAMRDRLAAEAAKPRASNAWARVGRVNGNTAIYLTFVGGTADDRLLRVSTAWATKSELHETVIDSSGVVRMLPALSGFALPAKERVVFGPGGKHVMLTGLKRELREGQTFPINLTFEKSGIVRVMVQVRVAPAMPAATEDHSGHH